MASDSSEPLKGKDYHWAFDPRAYLAEYYTNVEGRPDVPGLMSFIVQCLHETFHGGKIHGSHLLDIATGPSIVSVISASRWFDSITLSDYSPQNRAELESWLKRNNDAHDFSPFFKAICKLEGNEVEWTAIEERLRTSIKAISECDWTKNDIVVPMPTTPYDAVIGILSLENSVFDISSFEGAIRNVKGVLKVGGRLILSHVFGATFYSVGDKLFKAFSTNKSMIDEILKRCGFGDIEWTTKDIHIQIDAGDASGFYFVVARKL